MKNSYLIHISFAVFQIFIAASSFGESLHTMAKEGIEHYNHSEFDQAAQSFLQAREKQPDNPALTYNLANSQYKANKFEEALRAYSQSANSSDASLKQKSYYNLGNTLFRLGKLDESAQAYKTALKIDPSDMDAKFNLEFVREQIKKQKEQKQNNPRQSSDKSSQGTKRSNDSSSKSKTKNGPGDKKDRNSDKKQQAKNQDRSPGNKETSAKPKATPSEPKTPDRLADQTQSTARQKRGKMNKEEVERWLGSLVDNPRLFSQSQTHKKGRYPASMRNDW